MSEEEAMREFLDSLVIFGALGFSILLVALIAAPHKLRCPNCRKWFAERHTYADGTQECLGCHYMWHDPD
jgi:hypothetical protein